MRTDRSGRTAAEWLFLLRPQRPTSPGANPSINKPTNPNIMTADTTRKLDMLKRVNRFIIDQPIPSTMPRATAAHAEVVTTINALEAAAEGQATGSGGSEGGVELRAKTARELRSYLKNVTRTGRIIALDHPDVPAVFRLPRTVSYPALMAQARAITAAATPIQQSFIDAGLPATFLTELQVLLAAFENATGLKQGGGITQVLNTAALKARATLGVQAATKLDACVRNHYRNDPEMLAAWAHARRIERAPRSSPNGPSVATMPAISGAPAGSPQS
jgi:hypothetical protein